jgi:hypothetical protein
VLVIEDESGFYLLPGLVRTYAPKGRTPIIDEKQTRDHLTVMGAMTPEWKAYTLVRQESLNAAFRADHAQRVRGCRRLDKSIGRFTGAIIASHAHPTKACAFHENVE